MALSLPLLASTGVAAERAGNPRRLGCFYFPDGVPMPLKEDPAYQDWSWFPHGNGREFEFTKCFEYLAPLRKQMTVLSGFSHPHGRIVHGHNNADQFLTAAATGGGDMDYRNTISLDQEYVPDWQPDRFASLVMSTDGGTGTRGAYIAFVRMDGRFNERRPKRIFDMLLSKVTVVQQAFGQQEHWR